MARREHSWPCSRWSPMPDSDFSDRGQLSLRRGNKLLAALGSADLRALEPHLQTIDLERGAILIEPGERIDKVWLPHSGVISFIVILNEGGSAETATVGREGIVGYVATLCSRQALTRAIVQVPGSASLLPYEHFESLWNSSKSFRELMLCYSEALFAQLVQSVACNALHKIEARLCRWILMCRDRAESDVIPLTQEFLAEMLGVQRSTVNLVARALQSRGLIRYRRGNIAIIDPKQLQATSCECYATVRGHFERLLPGPSPASSMKLSSAE
jgi:CRP-like cAMP-binding protein